MRTIVITIIAVLIFSIAAVAGHAGFRLEGVKIRVPDLEEAKRFYVGTLGFPIERDESGKRVWLRTNSFRIVLEVSKDAKRIRSAGYSDVSLSMRVNDIDATFRRLSEAGVRFIKAEKRKEGVGWSLQAMDPFGNKISMMQITVGKPETVSEPSVYNCGLYVTDIEKALSTYKDVLAFTVRSRAYMPEDMPLGYTDGKFAFMLHLRRADFQYVENPNMILLFRAASVNDLEIVKKSGATITKKRFGETFELIDAVGVRSEIVVES